jgi:hypothetical protein
MCDDAVEGLEEVIKMTNQDRQQFGMVDPFPVLFMVAWKKDVHVIAAEGKKLQGVLAQQTFSPNTLLKYWQ